MKPSLKALTPALALLLIALPAPASAVTRTVCASGCDFTTPNAAVNDGNTYGGDVVQVAAGSYNGTVTIPAGKDGLQLVGAQAGKDAGTRNAAPAQESILQAPGDGVRFASQNVIIDGFTIQNLGAAAQDSTGILGVTFNESGFSLLNNIVKEKTHGIRADTGASSPPLRPSVIRGNWLADNNGPSNTFVSGVGITAEGTAKALTIDRNRFTGQTAYGIFIRNATADNVAITNNTSVQDRRFDVGDATNVKINGNTFIQPRLQAVYLAGGTNGVQISGNTIDGIFPGDDNNPAAAAGGIVTTYDTGAVNRNIEISGNNITRRKRGVSIGGPGGLDPQNSTDGSVVVVANRFQGNFTGAPNGAVVNEQTISLNAENNWFGCNAGPGGTGCDTVFQPGSGGVSFTPYLQLNASANPSSVPVGGATTVAATMQASTGNTPPAVSNFPAVPVSFGVDSGTLSALSSKFSSGIAPVTFTAPGSPGTSNVTATLDNATATAQIAVTAAPPSSGSGSGGSGEGTGSVAPDATLSRFDFSLGSKRNGRSNGGTVRSNTRGRFVGVFDNPYAFPVTVKLRWVAVRQARSSGPGITVFTRTVTVPAGSTGTKKKRVSFRLTSRGRSLLGKLAGFLNVRQSYTITGGFRTVTGSDKFALRGRANPKPKKKKQSSEKDSGSDSGA